MDLQKRLDEMEETIKKPAIRYGTGRGGEVGFWIFDYPPKEELTIRARIEQLKEKYAPGKGDFSIVVFDLYDLIIDYLEQNRFLEKCYQFEKKRGLAQVTGAVGRTLKLGDSDSYLTRYIDAHTPEGAVVFLTGAGKCYPLLRAHVVLNNLHQTFRRAPVILFFPGTYDGNSLRLFDKISDGNYYRAFRLVKG